MSTYKLTYYNSTGHAEPIRYIFAVAGVPFEDIRVPMPAPEEIKEKLPWNELPILEFDGKILAQSASISRFLARKFNLAGADDFESAKCDEYIDTMQDMVKEFFPFMGESDPVKRHEVGKNVKEVVIPKYFGKFSKIIESNGGKWLVGSNVTWADLTLETMIECLSIILDPNPQTSIADGFPAVQNLVKSVQEIPTMKKWKAERPKEI